jgi:chemotaxis protein methyltransferase CheR
MASSELSLQGYTFLQNYIHRESGIVLDDDKRYLIESRLLPIVRSAKLVSLDELCGKLAGGRTPELAAQVIDAMTTNETLFFRDTGVFEALRTTVLPARIAAAGNRTLRIWSAASSTGQEAYSIAMTLLEAGISEYQVEIVGTDLSDQVLERARAGRYLQFEVSRGLPAPLLAKYFTKAGLDWQISEQLRSMVRFEKLDLRSNLASFGPFDLVLCRNVLIYFNAETKQQILTSIAKTLTHGGLLVLGCAETLIGLDNVFKRKVFGHTTFYTL